MSTAKIAITIEKSLLGKLDALVRNHVFPNRSKAIQAAVSDKLDRIDRRRLMEECSKLDPAFEQSMAEEGIDIEIEQWPEY